MEQTIIHYCIAIVLAPLVASLLAGFSKRLGNRGAQSITLLGVGLSFVLSCLVFKKIAFEGVALPIDATLYQWGSTGTLNFQVGFMIDKLTALMMMVVTFVSWMVHFYTIGYMQGDPGYRRFFSYISLFTFAMLMLVMANNFLQLFFGWEAVGLVSYLLIGFWFQKESAIFANMKAFLVNRVGDFGFLLGIGGVLYLFGSLDYQVVFNQVSTVAQAAPMIHLTEGWMVSGITLTCLLLFVGAMGKSAQVPLHVWLPDSMEGPTPISALIHAATMVTAGVFMVARFSPLFEHSESALNFIMIIGATTAFFMGLIGIITNDIKRIIAYSTLSQLGYMMTAVAASAYGVAIFHLMTHAFFKALLFLGAGSVIIGMHHEQDIWKMGGLRAKMPITFACMLMGTLAIIGFPLFSGFYSKDLIIEAVKHSDLPASTYGYWAVLLGVFVTSVYSFRLLFVVFFGKPRMSEETFNHVHESPAVVWGPLVALAIPSVIIGGAFIGSLFEDFFGSSIVVHSSHESMVLLKEEFHGAWAMAQHGLMSKPFVLVLAGLLTSWFCYLRKPELPARIKSFAKPLVLVLEHKYGFDWFNQSILATGVRGIAWVFWKLGDKAIIDGLMVNGSAQSIGLLSKVVRRVQTGYLYHYVFAMITGVVVLLTWFFLVNH